MDIPDRVSAQWLDQQFEMGRINSVIVRDTGLSINSHEGLVRFSQEFANDNDTREIIIITYDPNTGEPEFRSSVLDGFVSFINSLETRLDGPPPGPFSPPQLVRSGRSSDSGTTIYDVPLERMGRYDYDDDRSSDSGDTAITEPIGSRKKTRSRRKKKKGKKLSTRTRTRRATRSRTRTR